MTDRGFLSSEDLPEVALTNVDDSAANDDAPDATTWDFAVGRNEPREQLRIYEGMVNAVRLGSLTTCRSSTIAQSSGWSEEGCSSGSAYGLVNFDQASGDETRDFQNKRAKVESDYNEFHYISAIGSNASTLSASADRSYNTIEGISGHSENNINDSFASVDTGDEKSFEPNEPKDEEGKNDTPLEDLEVRMDLTDDLLHMVFSFLDHHTLCCAAQVCRQWRSASTHEEFWRYLDLEDRSISMDQFEDICQRYPNVMAVNLYNVNCDLPGGPSIYSLAMKALSSLRNLKDLTLGRGGQIGDNFCDALTDCSALTKLNINDTTLGNGLQEISFNHDRLVHLQLTKCRVMQISIRCPQLETLSLKRSNMAQTVLSCPLLKELNIGSCHKLPDTVIRSVTTSCPQLVHLDVTNCSCLSDETLREIAFVCGSLKFLDASYCPNITLESVRLPMLTVLKLHNCVSITSASMEAIAHSYLLEVLELDNCSLLSSVSLELSRLQNMRLVHCRKFAYLNLRSAMLSSLLVSNCPALCYINITSISLQKLVLQKQDSLTTLALQCQNLQEVDLTDCESLPNSICDVFSDGGGCPLLRSLILDNCESLTAVRLCNYSLVNLSLIGCRAITALELNCPNLEKVCLDGCEHLESASFSPVVLHSLNLGICPKLNQLSIKAPQMVLLDLKGCGVLSDASIDCPCLISLDASFCSQLTDECLSTTVTSCPQIETLILMSCPSINYDGLCSLLWLPSLTVLDLSYTFLTSLEPIFESCSHLKVLKLQACKYLMDTSLEPLYKEGALPALQELDLSYGTLCQSAIEELLTFCTHLTHLSLNGCVNMHDLNWGLTKFQLTDLRSGYISSGFYQVESVSQASQQTNRLLQNLNCVGCPNIRKVLIPPMARCWHLLSLNLSLSAHLNEVDVTCFNLYVLNLSNCYSLEKLKLKCPKLSTLFLQSCNIDEEAIEVAISKCSMLETLDVRLCPKICSVSLGRLRSACPSIKRIFSSLPAL